MARFPRTIGDILAGQASQSRDLGTSALSVPELAEIQAENLAPNVITWEKLHPEVQVDLDENKAQLTELNTQINTQLPVLAADLADNRTQLTDLDTRLTSEMLTAQDALADNAVQLTNLNTQLDTELPALQTALAENTTKVNEAKADVAQAQLDIETATNVAVDAQTTADGKGRIWYQTTAPTPPRAQDLWFDTTAGAGKYLPKRYDPATSTWVSSTDKIAADANTAAAAAQQGASTADAKAVAAQAKADQATIDAANAKSVGDAAAAAGATADAKAVAAQTKANKAEADAAVAKAAGDAAAAAAATADAKGVAAQTAANNAATAAAAAQTSANNAATAAATADAKGVAAQTAANNAATAASAAQTSANTAATAAATADAKGVAAQTAANTADGKAVAAQTAATAASTLANAIVKTSTSAATGTPPSVGALWNQTNADGSLIINTWTSNAAGTAWVLRKLDDAVIGNLNAATINAGIINAARLQATDIRTLFLTAGKVTASDIVAGSLTSASGVFGTIDASIINAGTINAARLVAGDIRTKFLAAGTINASEITAGTLTSASGVFGTIDASIINAGTINAARFNAGDIRAKFIEAGKITASDIVAGTLTSASGVFGTIDASVINAGTINVARLAAADIRTKFLAAGTINASEITAGTLTSASGVFGTIDASIINAGTINAARLNATDIRSKFITAGKITAADITTGTLTSASGIFGTIDASVINAGTLNADRIAANSITASKITVTDLANFAPSMAESPDDWSLSGGMAIVGTAVDTSGKRLDSNGQTTGTQWARGPFMAVKPGESLYATSTVYRSTAPVGTGGVYLRYEWFDKDKVALSSPVYTGSPQSSTSGSGTKLELTAVVPATAAYARIALPITATAGNIGYTNIMGRRMNGAELIVDGAITADKITTNAITAGHVSAGAITADKIAVNSITADKVLISKGGNLLPDTQFVDVGSQTGWSPATYVTHDGAGTSGYSGGGSMLVSSSSTQAGSYYAPNDATRRPKIVPGSSYRVSVWVRPAASAPAGSFGLYLRAYNDVDNTYVFATSPGGNNTTTFASAVWARHTVTFQIPEGNYSSASVGLFVQAAFNNSVRFSDPSLQQAAGGELIVDGAILAKHIKANEITAGQLKAGTITATELASDSITTAKIAAGAVTATEILAGSIGTNHMTANSINGDRITSNTITAKHIVVSDTTNLHTDPKFNLGVVTLGSWAYNSTLDAGQGAISVTPAAGTTYAPMNPKIPATENTYMYFAVDAAVTGGTAPKFNLRVYCYDKDDTLTNFGVPLDNNADKSVDFSGLDGTYRTISGKFLIPTGTQNIVFRPTFYSQAGTGEKLYLTNARVFRASGGELIVDGAIQTNHIVAGAINGDRITANTITAAKLTIGDPANLLDDWSFEAGANSPWILGPGAAIGPDSGRSNTNALRCIVPASRTQLQVAQQTKLPVLAGDNLIIGAQIYISVATAATQQVYFTGTFRSLSGTALSTVTLFDLPNPTTTGWKSWTSAAITAPASTASMDFQVNIATAYAGNVVVDDIQVLRQTGATLIEDGAIQTNHMVANSINADRLVANSITASKLAATSIDGKTITGATIQTVSTANRGVKLTSTGIKHYDSSGNILVDIGSSTNTLVGDIATSRSGQAGIKLVNSSQWGLPAITYSYAGGETTNDASTFVRYSVNNDPELVHRAPNRSIVGGTGAGFVRVEGDLVLSLGNNSMQNLRCEQPLVIGAWSPVNGYQSMKLDGSIMTINATAGNIKLDSGSFYTQAPGIYSKTTGNAANMWITSDGGMFRSTSASKYKIMQREIEPDESLLDVPMKDWIDKFADEEHAEILAGPRPWDEATHKRFEAISLERIPGAVAEDVLAATGGKPYVTFGPDGEVEGLMYDRFALARTDVLKRKLQKAEDRIAQLEAQYTQLEARLSAAGI